MDRNIIKGKSIIQIYPTAGQKCDIVTRQSVSDYVHLIPPSRGICLSIETRAVFPYPSFLHL